MLVNALHIYDEAVAFDNKRNPQPNFLCFVNKKNAKCLKAVSL